MKVCKNGARVKKEYILRCHTDLMTAPLIDTPEKAAAALAFIRHEMREHFVCITLDAANRMIACRVISIGTLTASLVHPREVFADAITDRAASIVVGHNHPSGSCTPSDDDKITTKKLKDAGRLLEIQVVDHIIVTPKGFTSITVQ